MDTRNETKEVKDLEHDTSTVTPVDAQDSGSSQHEKKYPIPLKMKIISVIIVSMIGFGGHWSGGVTGALKSTLKKVRRGRCPTSKSWTLT